MKNPFFGCMSWVVFIAAILAVFHDVFQVKPEQSMVRAVISLIPKISNSEDSPPKVEASGPALIKSLRDISELTTVVATIEKVVPVTDETIWPLIGKVGESKLVYTAVGKVKAGIDPSILSANDIKQDGNKITITLPIAKILDVNLDLTKSKVFFYDQGNFSENSAPKMQEKAQLEAIDKIRQAACDNGLLKTATTQSVLVVSKLITLSAPEGTQVEVLPSQFEPVCSN